MPASSERFCNLYIYLQIASVRDKADASCATPKLTLEEKAAVAEKHAKRQADAQKRGISVLLRDIMAHKARPFAFLRLCLLP